MSRVLAVLSLVLSLLVVSVAGIAAQSTPEATGGQLAGLGYPEVTITATEAGFEVPDDVQAGAVLLTLDNQAPFPVFFALVQLPEGASMADLMPPPPASPEAGASPATEGGGEEFPPVLYDAVWAGGSFAMPGGSGQAVVELGAGDWLLMTPPEIGLPPATLNVTGEAGESPSVPEGGVAVELDNFQIVLPEQLPAGPAVWSVTNIGDQPHEFIVTKTPERLTVEEAQALLLMPPDAEPDPNLPNPEEFEEAGFLGIVSKDQTMMAEMALEPGHYVAVCFIPEKESGEPHAAKGMVVIFSVGAEGEEVEPPASPVPEEHEGH